MDHWALFTYFMLPGTLALMSDGEYPDRCFQRLAQIIPVTVGNVPVDPVTGTMEFHLDGFFDGYRRVFLDYYVGGKTVDGKIVRARGGGNAFQDIIDPGKVSGPSLRQGAKSAAGQKAKKQPYSEGEQEEKRELKLFGHGVSLICKNMQINGCGLLVAGCRSNGIQF
jgi:hypothetical protein